MVFLMLVVPITAGVRVIVSAKCFQGTRNRFTGVEDRTIRFIDGKFPYRYRFSTINAQSGSVYVIMFRWSRSSFNFGNEQVAIQSGIPTHHSEINMGQIYSNFMTTKSSETMNIPKRKCPSINPNKPTVTQQTVTDLNFD